MANTKSMSILLSEDFLKIVEGVYFEGKWQINSLALQNTDIDIFSTSNPNIIKQLANQLSNLVSSANMNKSDVTLILPDSQSYSKIMKMPFLTEKEMIAAIRYQADQFIPIPIDQISLDIEILSENKQSKEIQILLVAASSLTIQIIAEIIDKAGLNLTSVETETSSALRLINNVNTTYKSLHPQFEPIPAYFINIGTRSTTMILYDTQNDIPLLTHNIALGYNLFIKDLMLNNPGLDKNKAAELLVQIGLDKSKAASSLSQAAYRAWLIEIVKHYQQDLVAFPQKNVPRWYIFGDGVRIKHLSENLSTDLKLPVENLIMDGYIDFGGKLPAQINWQYLVTTLGGLLNL